MKAHLEVYETRLIGGTTYELTARTPIPAFNESEVSMTVTMSGDEVLKAIRNGIDVEISATDQHPYDIPTERVGAKRERKDRWWMP